MSILEEHPRWVEHEQRVAELQARRAKVSAAAREEAEAYRAALDAHREAVEKAADQGHPIPQEAPEKPGRANTDAIRHLQREHDLLRDEEKRLKAEVLPDLEAAARGRWATRRDDVAAAVAVLAEAAQELRQDARVVAEARTLADSQKKAIPRPTAGERTVTRWGVEEVVDVLQHGRDPFALVPVERGGPRIMDGHGAPESTPPRRPSSRTRPAGFVRL
ncbi:hypothetical protein [Janibacter limosus]|uniref:Uncharacterized protein n=1 Tax=Janibacter limosus TaxID=53458 RepID=A0A4P6MWU4_9MICO|nr:hypothetical protein [Janibacter limosus]QBF46387.1 hypothetical protein EXU32_09070 [Janibacter limosus]